MRQVPWLAFIILATAAAGCGIGGNTISVGFAPPRAPIPPGERAEARITVRFSDDSGPWAGRRVKVSVHPPADVVVEPAEVEVELDGSGSAVVRVYIVPDKAAASGPREMAITATGPDAAISTLQVEVAVK